MQSNIIFGVILRNSIYILLFTTAHILHVRTYRERERERGSPRVRIVILSFPQLLHDLELALYADHIKVRSPLEMAAAGMLEHTATVYNRLDVVCSAISSELCL